MQLLFALELRQKPSEAGRARASANHACLRVPCCRCRKNLAGAFRSHIINSRAVDSVAAAAPVRLLGSTSFLYMRKNDVYILAVTKNNANAMSTFYFMNSVSFLGTCSLDLAPLASGSI